MKNINIRKGILGASSALNVLAIVGAGLTVAGIATPAAAQESVDLEDTGERIIVTGTRLNTSVFQSTAPIQIVDEVAIEDAGVTNIQSLLLENPVFGTPTYARTNSSFNSATSGIASVDLRNLGVDRTLVLVNGRRMVGGVPGTAAVDLNMIPAPLIERVDVLTSGSGSAIYGSDAVAGVVNFIMKDDFEGIQINGLTGITDDGEDFRYQADLTIGGNFADGRGNGVLYVGYTNEEGTYRRNLETEVGSSFLDSTSSTLAPNSPIRPAFSSYAPQGTYFTDNYAFTYADQGNGALRPCVAPSGGICDLEDTPLEGSALDGTAIGPDGFNRAFYRLLTTPLERWLVSASTTYDITDGIEVFGEASFSSVNAVSNIEPFASDSGDVYDDGQYPIETLYEGTIYRNPFVPDAIFDDASDTNGDGLRDIFFSKRLLDFGPRRSEARRETFRVVGGVRGEITDGWDFEAFGQYGQTVTAQLGSGQYNVLNFREAAQIIPDGQGGFQCADETAVGQGCVPVNIFGLNSYGEDAINYLAAGSTFNATVKQTVVGANITGEPFYITPDAPVGVVVGTEYRRESSAEIWDPLQTAGLNASNAFPPTSGEFDLYEFYGEAIVPLIVGGIVDDLSIRGAARYSHYSTIGDTFSWNAGIDLAPIPELRLRAMYSETVRAPNISELFDGLNQTFPTVEDPCVGITADGSALANNCLAFAGVQQNLDDNGGTFVRTLADRQGVTGFTGGNPNLQEETGQTWTVGATFAPRSIDFLSGFVFSVDYFNIEIQDAIVNTPRQYILNQCFNEGIQSFCDFVTRLPTAQGSRNAGALDEVNTGPSNSGGEGAEGIDFVVNYSNTFDIGSMPIDANFGIRYTRLLEQYTQPLPTSALDYTDGEIGSSKDRFTTNLAFATDSLRLSFTGTYVGEAFFDDQVTGVPEGDDDTYRFHPEFYLDSQVRYTVSDGYELFVGVDNLLDNKPIFAASIPGAADTGQEVFGGTYDPLGRRFYGGVKFEF